MKEILVSISCTTYNHEEYISRAIESFLMQKTNFKFEILIHDDASTDGTTEIIKEYEQKYPDIIKPMYQKENQYSLRTKGVKVRMVQFNFNRAKGKYMAFCDGDDYWTDPYKLQKQVDFMEANPEYSMCGHITSKFNVETQSVVGTIPDFKTSKELKIDDMLNGVIFQTSSVFIRFENMLNSKDEVHYPEFYMSAPAGDYALQLYMFSLGKVYCLKEVMSHYNWNAIGSWTKATLSDIKKRNNFTLKIIDMLKLFNEETDYKNDAFVQNALAFQKSLLFSEDDNMIDLTQLLLKVNDNLERIYIFGSGAFGQSVAEILMGNNVVVEGFIDNDVAKVDTEINNLRICSLNMVEQDSLILICSQWHSEIAKQLLEDGFTNYYKLTSWQK